MGKRYWGYLIATAIVFGLIGLIAGQFVTIPNFRAYDGGGSEVSPLEAIVYPGRKNVNKVKLEVVWEKDLFDSCPDDWAVAEPMPFLTRYEAVSIKRLGSLQNFNVSGIEEKKIKPTKTLVYGYIAEYEIETRNNEIVAVHKQHNEKVRKVSRFYEGTQELETDLKDTFRYIPFKHYLESDLVGWLEFGKALPQLEDVTLCVKPIEAEPSEPSI